MATGNIPKSRLKYGEANFNIVFRDYQQKARLANREWNLTKEEFKKLTKKNCFYCNAPPNNEKGTSRQRHYGTYIYSGLDRADNSEGYTMGNCRPCCARCNRMKRAMSTIEFKHHIKKIVEKLGL